ncbi:MAG: transglutaminase domain-containing protein [Sandaracinaceae bacterium]
MRRWLVVLVVIPSLALSADAQDAEPILHEYVPDLGSDEGTVVVSSGGETPDAIVYQGELLPPPDPGPMRADERAMRAGAGDSMRSEEVGRRSPSFRPDRVTDLQGTIGYYAVFTPSIAPFKRVTALDRVSIGPGGIPEITIHDETRTIVPIEGAGSELGDGVVRDRFWGSVVLDFAEGATVPLPSVAPSSRILTLETDPPTPLTISKDRADNFYATAPAGVRHEVRVTFLTDAPRAYFAAPVPDGPVDMNAELVPPMPATVAHDGLELAGEIGVDRSSTYVEALAALTAHFRSFEESSAPPRDTGNIFLDLARGMRGICRHRAYGFVLTAHALGMPARFVQNEAHAWVEVMLPDRAWMRVDLGGAANGLEPRGLGDRPSYRPTERDPLPRPPEYERAYAEAARFSAAASPGAMSAEGSDEAGAGASPPPGAGSAFDGPTAVPTGVDHARGAVALLLDRRQFEVFRGRELEVTGSVRGDGAPIAGLRVEVVLRAPRGETEWLLGVTVSRETGRFRGVFGIPPDLPVGDYTLSVRTPGDARWGAAVAR